jgi:hypothetical protein
MYFKGGWNHMVCDQCTELKSPKTSKIEADKAEEELKYHLEKAVRKY